MKIYVQTYGCSFNVSDSETMMGLLQEAGHSIVKEMEQADLLIINTCTVKGPSESKFFTRLSKIKTLGKHLVIAGCIAQTDPKALQPYSTIGTDCVEDIVEVVEETAKGHIVRMAKRHNSQRLNLPKVRVNPVVEIIPICKGCLGECTYCKTVQARGRLYSFAPEAIVERVKEAVRDGAKEIWLTSQDDGAYGKDIGTNLVELLRAVVKVRGDFKVRVGMANPNHIIKMVDELIEIFQHKKIYKFLHLPVQAGSNSVLAKMKREYTIEEYTTIVEKFRQAIPEITIATDIIVAFPGETDEDYEKTLQLIRETKPNVMNLSRYWKRSGTLASKMKQVHGSISTARAKKCMQLFESIAKEQNQQWKDWQGEVLISEVGKNIGDYVGRNAAYKPVILQHAGKRDLLGKQVNVKIDSTTRFDLRGNILS